MRLSRIPSFLVLLAWLWGCGGGSNTTPPSLSSIVVTPASVTLWAGLGTQQFTATGHYTDGSIKDLTNSVIWSSSSPSVASVAGGIATPLVGGTTNIQAKSGGVSGASPVTVVGLANAYITPSGPALSLTGSPSGTQLSATGVWTDGKSQDVTSLVSWSSSDVTIAGVNASGYVSRATNAGYATVSAKWGSATLSTAVSITTQSMTASNLSGTYVFLLNGPRPDSFTGLFTADGSGNITGQLVAVSGSDIIPMPTPFTGTYSVFPDGRGDMTMEPSAPLSTTHLRFALGANGDQGRWILFDPARPTAMTGVFQRQSAGPFSLLSLQGTYVFKFGGTDSNNQPQTIVGMLTTNGTGQVVSGLADWNDNSVINNGGGRSSPLNVTGSYILGSDGHGAMTLNIGPAQLHFAMFVVSSGLFRLLCTDPSNRLLGQFEVQQMPQGGFQSMNTNYTFLLENGGRAGVFGMGGEIDFVPTMGGWGTVTSPGTYSDLEVHQGASTMTTGGRGTLDVTFFVRPSASNSSYSFAAYMVSPVRVYLIETDTQSVFAGLAQGINVGNLSGRYLYMAGGLKVASGTESAVLALLDASSLDPHSGTFSGIIDVNLPASGLAGVSRVFGSTVAAGTFSADANSMYTKWMASFAGNQNFTLYVNSSYQAVMFGQTGVSDNPDIAGWIVRQ